MAYCHTCDRYFTSDVALGQHHRQSSRHVYCWRCDRPFGSHSAWEQHVRNSYAHDACPYCDDVVDFENNSDLERHFERVHHRCIPCRINFETSDDLDDHDRWAHYMCSVCRKYNDSEHNLKAHLRKHDEKSLICFGCPRSFATYSAMLLHLEPGACAAPVDEWDIVNYANECYVCDYYITNDAVYKFECPPCDRTFKKMSGLLQHVESDTCPDDLEPGSRLWKFLRYLRENI
ncbi:uncharacterized protein F5Z01DRAFT_258389 [Emericellopsis atlantica]|uniref:C2H2-type domain-containing protein n=1 Tax=Emericellopsis atlantica TaxID=2614577 RepID=A0A9P7ZGW6_9HYPO|nr:uncharacterized protein F5Z01DRAFT_258389 [Emericellopsis atlantica]KAG9251933.1 hypothetical protein F5Z01DRAFT_258389 [Emericellopsis atlantica]